MHTCVFCCTFLLAKPTFKWMYYLGVIWALAQKGAGPCSFLQGHQSVCSELCQRVSELPTSIRAWQVMCWVPIKSCEAVVAQPQHGEGSSQVWFWNKAHICVNSSSGDAQWCFPASNKCCQLLMANVSSPFLETQCQWCSFWVCRQTLTCCHWSGTVV